MNKNGIMFTVFALCMLLPLPVAAQERPMVREVKPGVVVVTTPKGTGPMFRPDRDTPITKLRYKAQEPLLLGLYDKKVVNGYKASDYDDCLERLDLEKDELFLGEMIPEQKTPEKIQLFFHIYAMTAMFDIEATKENVLKLIYFESVTEEQRLTKIPLLLIYEDDPQNGMNEQFLQKYMKDGKLIVDETLYEEAIHKLQNYRLIYYKIQYKEK